MDRIETDYREATAVGASASPFTVVIEPDMRRSFEGSREFVEIAGALLSSIQTFEQQGILPLQREELPVRAVVPQPVATTTASTTDDLSSEEQDEVQDALGE